MPRQTIRESLLPIAPRDHTGDSAILRCAPTDLSCALGEQSSCRGRYRLRHRWARGRRCGTSVRIAQRHARWYSIEPARYAMRRWLVLLLIAASALLSAQ